MMQLTHREDWRWRAHRWILGAGIVVDINRRRHVEMDVKRRRVSGLRCEEAVQEGVYLTELAVSAGYVHAVAIGRRRLAADEMIAFLDGDDEQRVRLIDTVLLQASEECCETGVVVDELLYIAGLSWAVSALRDVMIVRIGKVTKDLGMPASSIEAA